MKGAALRTRRPSPKVASAALLALLAGVFALNILFADVTPSSAWGLGYGTAATILLVGVAAYAARRRAPGRGPGTAHAWLQFHIYGGLGFLVLALMHTGFRLPHGFLAWCLWLLTIYVCVSGMVGVILQRWLPRVLSSAFTTEVNYDRVPELIGVLRHRVEELVGSCDDRVQRFYDAELAASFAGPQPRLTYFLDAAGSIHARAGQLDHLRSRLAAADAVKLDDLKVLLVNKLEMDAQFTLQRALRLWAIGHVPVSLVLLVLVAFHLFSIWYY